MLSLSDNNQTDIIEAFKSTSRYLDDLLNIDNPYFEQIVGQIYPTELQLNLFVFVALRPMSTAMVIAGRSVHLTTLFPGQA